MAESGIEWTAAVCADGPLRGRTMYCSNVIGCTLTIREGVDGPLVVYELTHLAEGGKPAQLSERSDT